MQIQYNTIQYLPQVHAADAIAEELGPCASKRQNLHIASHHCRAGLVDRLAGMDCTATQIIQCVAGGFVESRAVVRPPGAGALSMHPAGPSIEASTHRLKAGRGKRAMQRERERNAMQSCAIHLAHVTTPGAIHHARPMQMRSIQPANVRANDRNNTVHRCPSVVFWRAIPSSRQRR